MIYSNDNTSPLDHDCSLAAMIYSNDSCSPSDHDCSLAAMMYSNDSSSPPDHNCPMAAMIYSNDSSSPPDHDCPMAAMTIAIITFKSCSHLYMFGDHASLFFYYVIFDQIYSQIGPRGCSTANAVLTFIK